MTFQVGDHVELVQEMPAMSHYRVGDRGIVVESNVGAVGQCTRVQWDKTALRYAPYTHRLRLVDVEEDL